MLKKIFLLAVFASIFGFALFYFWKKYSFSRHPSPVLVDVIQDQKGLGYTGQRKIVTDKKGNFYVSYRKNYLGNSEIFVARLTPQKTGYIVSGTQRPVAVIGKNNDQRVPSLAIDSKEVLHLVWYGSDIENENSNRQIKYTRSFDRGETWSGWRNVAFVSGFDPKESFWQEHPTLFIGKKDILYVVWEGKDEKNSRQQVKFIRSENGGNTWSVWKNVAPFFGAAQSRPTIVQNSQGFLYLFMYSTFSPGKNGSDGIAKVYSAFSRDEGKNWSPWERLSDPLLDSRHISAAIDAKNNVHLLWRSADQKNSFSQIYYLRKRQAGGNGGDSLRISDSSSFQFFPALSIFSRNKKEFVFAAWMENQNPSQLPNEDPSGGKIFFSLFENGLKQKPVSINQKESLLYPHFLEKTSEFPFLPLLYSETLGEKKFALIVDFLEIK